MQTNEIWTADEFKRYHKNGAPPLPKKASKYGNEKSKVDNKTFDSKKEANRYQELKNMVSRGLISELHEQVKFTFVHNGEKICSYVADFTYNENGKEVVEDVKSEMTRKLPVYRIKKKMMLAFYGIEIKEV